VTRVVLSIGANLGNRAAALQLAVDTFRPWLRAVSPVYRTPPWGPVEQPDYLNAVLIAEDLAARPADWLARAQAAEQAAGRVRDVRWGPRTLDVDVIAVDAVVSADPVLTLPHPRAAERAFVLVPWLVIEPAARLGGVAVADLARALPGSDLSGVQPEPSVVLR
jgi:2-amino-4-hydroxy-6-hydroxymethyldihydropteridine diphosphokinase